MSDPDEDEVLQWIRDYRLILLYNGALWSPNQRVPMPVRRGIKQHRAALLALIAQSDIRVCASPSWHRAYWKRSSGQSYICEVCETIKVS